MLLNSTNVETVEKIALTLGMRPFRVDAADQYLVEVLESMNR